MPDVAETSPAEAPSARPRRLGGWGAAGAVLVAGLVVLLIAGTGREGSAFLLRFVGCAAVLGSFLLWPRFDATASTRTASDQPDGAQGAGSRFGWSAPQLQALGVVFLVGTGVRCVVAITEPMHYDEAYTVAAYSSQSITTILGVYDAPNNHLLHSLLVKPCLMLFGHHEFAIRLPVLLAGSATIVATAWLTARLASPRPALVAAALVAVAPPLIAYSATARGYALTILGFVLLLAVVNRLAVEDERRRRDWLALAALSAFALMTVPTAAMGVGGAWAWGVFLLVAGRRTVTAPFLLRTALVAGVVVALVAQLYVPLLGEPGFDFRTENETRKMLTDAVAAWSTGWGQTFAYALVALAAVGLVVARREWRSHVAALGLTVVLLAIWVFALALGQVVPFIRTYLYLVPLLLMLAAVGITWLLSRVEDRLPAHVAELLAPTLALLVLVPGLVIGARPEAWDLDQRRVADPAEVVAESERLAPGAPLLVSSVNVIPYGFYALRDSLTHPVVETLDPKTAPRAVLPVTEPGDLESYLALASLTRDQVQVEKAVRLDRNILYLVKLRPGAVVAKPAG